MEHLDPLPVDTRKTRESFEKLKLSGTRGRDNAGFPSFLYGLAKGRGSLFGRNLGHFAFVVEALDHHVDMPPKSGFRGNEVSRFLVRSPCHRQAELHGRKHIFDRGTWDVLGS